MPLSVIIFIAHILSGISFVWSIIGLILGLLGSGWWWFKVGLATFILTKLIVGILPTIMVKFMDRNIPTQDD